MRLGLSSYNITASDFTELTRAANDLGFESMWLGEHIVLPLAYGSEHPTTNGSTVQHHTGPIIDPNTILIDPLVAFGAAAAVSDRLTLATGIYLIPLRHPILIARATATLQDLCGGRFLLGAGSGWLREEFDALGIGFDGRAGRFDETIDALRALWSGDVVTHHGPHFQFGPVQLGPQPVHVPLILGGNTDPALRRVAARADGWFSSGTPSFEDALTLRERIDAHVTAAGRTRPLPLWFRSAAPDAAALDQYRREGFDEVVLWADRFWPNEGDVATKREVFRDRLTALGFTDVLNATR
jgi:probable F420-dependent oxidoreductase